MVAPIPSAAEGTQQTTLGTGALPAPVGSGGGGAGRGGSDRSGGGKGALLPLGGSSIPGFPPF